MSYCCLSKINLLCAQKQFSKFCHYRPVTSVPFQWNWIISLGISLKFLKINYIILKQFHMSHTWKMSTLYFKRLVDFLPFKSTPNDCKDSQVLTLDLEIEHFSIFDCSCICWKLISWGVFKFYQHQSVLLFHITY